MRRHDLQPLDVEGQDALHLPQPSPIPIILLNSAPSFHLTHPDQTERPPRTHPPKRNARYHQIVWDESLRVVRHSPHQHLNPGASGEEPELLDQYLEMRSSLFQGCYS